jgi:hypothetical protein
MTQNLTQDQRPINPFYLDRAVHHGEMVAYYVNDRPSTAYGQDWNDRKQVEEAREAWHFATLLTQSQIEDELLRRLIEPSGWHI